MHSKGTVVYICEDFVVSGKKLFWKQEILTTDSYKNTDSLYWSRRKPISGTTFSRAQRAGYRCETVRVTRPPGSILLFTNLEPIKRKSKKKAHRNTKDGRSAIMRFLSR